MRKYVIIMECQLLFRYPSHNKIEIIKVIWTPPGIGPFATHAYNSPAQANSTLVIHYSLTYKEADYSLRKMKHSQSYC